VKEIERLQSNRSPVYLHCFVLVQHVRKYDFFFQIAYDIARLTKDAFHEKALPKFFQCAPAIGIYETCRGGNSSEVNQKSHIEHKCTN